MVVVAGTRIVAGMTRAAKVAGGSAKTVISTFLRIVAGRLTDKKGMTFAKFNSFSIIRETTERYHGPRAKRAVVARTRLTPGFGTKGTLGSTIGWVLGY